MQIGLNKKQIQPRWPLRISPEVGPYESVANSRESILQNFVFLLQTIPGEWPMNPDLGVGIANYLFEGYLSSELDEFKSRLKKQLSKYLPSIQLVEAEFIHSDEDIDSLSTVLKITYFIKLLGIVEEIDFGLDPVKKSVMIVSPQQSKIGKLL